MRGQQHCRLFVFAVVAAVAATVADAQNFSVLYNFGSKSTDPYQPYYSGIVAQGRDGNLYSTAPNGPASSYGAVFRITPGGTLKVVYVFDGTQGQNPNGGLSLGTDGNFYGTTTFGGTSGYGTVFKVTPTGSLTTLYNFTDGSDGTYPSAPPIQATDGNFYGTTCGDSCSGGSSTYGTIYKITSSGKFTPLYQFDITQGGYLHAPLVQGTDGSLYGTAQYGGTNTGDGVVFKITPAGKLTVLYNFDGTHGANPIGPLVQGSDGNFYGTTTSAGASGVGVVFKITPAGKLAVLHNLNGTTEGYSPFAGLVQGTDGNFYGANSLGGKPSSGCSGGCGTSFMITPKGKFTVLHNFDLTTGSTPYDSPFQHTSGVVYGETQLGGTGSSQACAPNCGVFYSLKSTTLPPFVTLLPYVGKVGKTIEFLGQGFTSKTTVSFNGTAASPTVVSSTYLTAAVPSGAPTGPVMVTTSGGTLTSNKIFRVTPQILSFKPTSGPVGTAVTITGVSLTQTTKVTFGGVKATSVTVISDTQVTATVPTGAVTGHIAITTAGGTAVSSGIFTVTH